MQIWQKEAVYCYDSIYRTDSACYIIAKINWNIDGDLIVTTGIFDKAVCSLLAKIEYLC